MSRESKIITASEFNAEKTIYHYESFGWELLSINGNQITMSRETQNPVYQDLVKHQAKYEALFKEYKTVAMPYSPKKPYPFSIATWFKSLLCLIVPCIVYTTYKIVQNNKYKQALAKYNEELAQATAKKSQLMEEMEEVAIKSRTIFFSKQS